MTKDIPQELLEKNLITQSQFERIDQIVSGKIASVFYELRTLLYLGVMLLTAGLGILIYENIGELGHLLSIIDLCLVTHICFWYVFAKGAPFPTDRVKHPTLYIDYIVLPGSLLFFSAQGYLYYYGFNHPAITLTIAEIILLGISLALLNYLKTMKAGYTRENLLTDKWSSMNAEAFIISQTMGGNQIKSGSSEGGGGNFGGGGTSGNF
ncbi:MAG TPA: DUF2157 domain-containing protein [Cyclobacteriaceae bacterium]